MRLDELTIEKFKNLTEFHINFDEKYPYTMLVGQNGSGKSNLIEAIVLIFRHLDLNESAPFSYHLKYQCRGYKIEVKCKESQYPSCKVDSNEIVRSKFLAHSDQTEDGRSLYLPRFVFGYYSGPGNRLQSHFNKHQKIFYDELISVKQKSKELLRPFFYVQPLHGQFALLSFFGYKDSKALMFLKEELGIEELTAILFSISEPNWGAKVKKDIFWGARATVRDLLDKLYEIALAPMKAKQSIKLGFRKKMTKEFRYLYLDLENDNSKLLGELATHYGRPQDFFKVLESTYISELLSEVRCTVKVRNYEGRISFRELSEGEQQLLMVLGLMRFTQEDEALFLLDEPDTHLNPVWSVQYLRFVEQLVGKLKKSHIIMATHDPLVFAGLKKEEVRVLQRKKEGQIIADEPETDPRGMGFANILKSDLFGLRSSVDPNTLEKLDRRSKLYAKGTKRSAKETSEIQKLSDELASLGFLLDYRDPIYDNFAKAMSRRQEFQKPVLSQDEIKKQERIADEILDGILKKKTKK
jgi:predicted ATPase